MLVFTVIPGARKIDPLVVSKDVLREPKYASWVDQ
jgi:hypothetical protein